LWLERLMHDDLPLLQRIASGTPDAGDALAANPVAAILTEASAQGVVRRLLHDAAGLGAPRLPNTAGLRFSSTGDDHATLVEPLEKPHPALWLYGAGHVGQALVRALADLPFDVTWVDSRASLFPEMLPVNVHKVSSLSPIDTTDSAPANALFLIMTHDHTLDYALCRRILERATFAWLGLIGSKSKGARFRSRLARDGLPGTSIARLKCPIGIAGVNSKLPAAIAVAVAAQLLRGVDSSATIEISPTDGPAPEDACSSPDCSNCSSRCTTAEGTSA
jgi:xanthine dehydrogenase accessory factor